MKTNLQGRNFVEIQGSFSKFLENPRDGASIENFLKN